MRGEATVSIRAIGALWMPQCPAAWHRDYRVGDGPFQHDIRSLDDAEHRLTVDSGDLSRIDDYEIRVTVRRVYTRPGVVGGIHHTRTVVWRPWERGEDSELAWADATFPAEEEE